MGYGTRAMKLLTDYYSGLVTATGAQAASITDVGGADGSAESADLLHEVIAPRKSLPPLLSELSERAPETLDYMGVAFGLTTDLLRWVSMGDE